MTSIKFHFRASRSVDVSKAGKLYLRVIHKRKSKDLTTRYSIYPEEWDDHSQTLRFPSEDSPRRRYLLDVQHRMSEDLKRLESSVRLLSAQGEYTVDDVFRGFTTIPSSDSLEGYCHRVSVRLEDSGRERTARAYRSSIRSLIKFNSGNDFRLSDIRSGLIRRYEQYLIDSGLQMNTVSFYLRNIRALYYRAVSEKLIDRQCENPFDKVFTGVAETRRRALSVKELNSLARVGEILSDRIRSGRSDKGDRDNLLNKRLEDSLLYFLFCYHARGMSFVDMAYLRKSEVRNGVISYQRKKTGGWLHVKVTSPMSRILSHFSSSTSDSPYVFPVIDPVQGGDRRQYENGLSKQNRLLKVLGGMAGLRQPLSTHVSRHTWATLAKLSREDISVISEALGHRDIKTTYKYLASFERSTLDRLSDKMSGMIQMAS